MWLQVFSYLLMLGGIYCVALSFGDKTSGAEFATLITFGIALIFGGWKLRKVKVSLSTKWKVTLLVIAGLAGAFLLTMGVSYLLYVF